MRDSFSRPNIHHSTNVMEATHGLPLDILRLLFEFSASTSIESAKVLSLVSKEVQSWTDPHLFQIVRKSGTNSSGISETSLLGRMCMPDASPRIILARNYVRSLVWDRSVPNGSYTEQALKLFPNLTQLCLWENIFPCKHKDPLKQDFEITQSYPSLQRVATCLYGQSSVPPNAFSSPFWMTITHLQVRFVTPISFMHSAFQLPLFISMTSLTHLALSRFTDIEELDTNLAFSRVRGTFPPSLTLCLLDLMPSGSVSLRNRFEDMTEACLKIDERIVMWWPDPRGDIDEMAVVRSNDSFQDWCRVQDGVQTFWDLGDAVLKRRQEQLKAV